MARSATAMSLAMAAAMAAVLLLARAVDASGTCEDPDTTVLLQGRGSLGQRDGGTRSVQKVNEEVTKVPGGEDEEDVQEKMEGERGSLVNVDTGDLDGGAARSEEIHNEANEEEEELEEEEEMRHNISGEASSCPKKCRTCDAGRSKNGGQKLIDGKCLSYCSEGNQCGCGNRYSGSGSTDCTGCGTSWAPTTSTIKGSDIGDKFKNYPNFKMYCSNNCKQKRAFIVALHGSGQAPEILQYQLLGGTGFGGTSSTTKGSDAFRNRFMCIAFPESLNGKWADNNDVDYIKGITAYAKQKFNADAQSLHLFGYSAGGALASKLACNDGNGGKQYASLVMWNSVYDASRIRNGCRCRKQLHLLFIASTEDAIVPYDGFGGLCGAEMTVDTHATLNRCRSSSTKSALDLDVHGRETKREESRDCAECGSSTLWKAVGSKHVWDPTRQQYEEISSKHQPAKQSELWRQTWSYMNAHSKNTCS